MAGRRGGWLVLERFLARRMLGSRKRSYVSLVSTVSTLGLALGVASLVVIFSVTAGFEEVFREKILGVYPHLVVIGKGGDVPKWKKVVERLEGQPHIDSVSPATYDEMMASRRGRRAGCIVKGIDAAAPEMAAVLQPFIGDDRLDQLHLEPKWELTGDTLRVSGLPGGAYYIAVLAPGDEVRVISAYEEEGEMPRVRILSARRQPTDITIGGILMDIERVLAPAGLTEFVEVPEGETELTVDGELHVVQFGTANHTVVVADHGDRTTLFKCREAQPGSGSDPARVCVVNLLDRPVSLALSPEDQAGISVPPRLATVLEESRVVRPKVILGTELARTIEASPGDEVRLVSPLFSVQGIADGRRPGRTIADTFIVAGTVSLGFHEYDSKLALLDYSAARRFLHQGDTARWVEVRVDDIFAAEQRGVEIGRFLSDFSLLDVQAQFGRLVDKYETAAATLEPSGSAAGVARNSNDFLGKVKFSNIDGELSLGFEDNYRIISWEEMNEPLFTSMKRQKIVLSLFFLIIIVVAAFNVVTSQSMIVKEKSSDIAILKAVGATDRQVRRIVLLQGMSVGVLGTAAGLVVAAAGCILLDKVGFPLDPEVYFVSKLPVHLRIRDMGLSAALALVAIYLAVSVAARKAARKSPVEGFRELD